MLARHLTTHLSLPTTEDQLVITDGAQEALPVTSADPYLHAAARHGVTVAPGALACVDGRHRDYVRLSFAEQHSALELAVERLAAAWESHSMDLAAAPTRNTRPSRALTTLANSGMICPGREVTIRSENQGIQPNGRWLSRERTKWRR